MDGYRQNGSDNTKETKPKKSGGLYGKVNMSLKSADRLVSVGILLLVLVSAFAVYRGGFTVRFDTDGGSHIEPQKVYHSERIAVPPEPVREGYVFSGWYTDRACTAAFDPNVDTVTQSMVLYAAWVPQ